MPFEYLANKHASHGQLKIRPGWMEIKANPSLPYEHIPFCWFCHTVPLKTMTDLIRLFLSRMKADPDVIIFFPCSTQLSMNFKHPIDIKIEIREDFSSTQLSMNFTSHTYLNSQR